MRADRLRSRRTARAARRVEAAEVRRFTRRSRRRRAVGLTAVGLLVLVVGVPLILAVSPAFAVRHLDIDGGSAAVTAAVRGRLAREIGTPIALVDLVAVGRSIGAVPQVQSYSVASLPPNTLRITLVQRTPIAVVRRAGRYEVVDAARVVLATSVVRPSAYPLVSIAASGTASGPAFTAVAEVLRRMPGPVLGSVRSVTASSPDDVTLRLDSGQTVLWGSAGDSGAKADALRAALIHAAAHAKHIDVSSPGVVSIR